MALPAAKSSALDEIRKMLREGSKGRLSKLAKDSKPAAVEVAVAKPADMPEDAPSEEAPESAPSSSDDVRAAIAHHVASMIRHNKR